MDRRKLYILAMQEVQATVLTEVESTYDTYKQARESGFPAFENLTNKELWKMAFEDYDYAAVLDQIDRRFNEWVAAFKKHKLVQKPPPAILKERDELVAALKQKRKYPSKLLKSEIDPLVSNISKEAFDKYYNTHYRKKKNG